MGLYSLALSMSSSPAFALCIPIFGLLSVALGMAIAPGDLQLLNPTLGSALPAA